MQINRIDIDNFQGLRHAALAVSEPLVLVSGGNGAGKSSLMDAISIALTGQPRRVSLKKDLGKLVTEGKKKGAVSVLTPDGEFGIALPAGKGVHLADNNMLPFVLDASRFAALDGKERRKVLFELTGASVNPNTIGQRLIDAGALPAMVEKIKLLLRSGFPAAADQAKAYASEARGAWKALTGENYGSEKAEGWEPEQSDVQVTEEQIAAAAEALAVLEQDLTEATETLGGHRQQAEQIAQQAERIAALTGVAAQRNERQTALDHARADLAHWQKLLDETKAMAAGTGRREGLIHDLARALAAFEEIVDSSEGYRCDKGLITPWFNTRACDRMRPAMDRYRKEYGVEDEEAEGKHDPAEVAKNVSKFETVVSNLKAKVQECQRQLDEAVGAAAKLEELQQAARAVPPADAIENAEQAIALLRQQRDAARAKHQALTEAFQAIAERQQVIANAAEYHAEVQAWVMIADQLAPTGIPSQILAEAIGPMNELLADLSARAGWAEASINADIDIEYTGRLYGLLSESEQWRVDTLLAVAIAKLSGLGFVLLDRFDVLEPASRPQALKLLIGATRDGTLQQAFMAGTMKAPMAKLPQGVQQVWIDGGVIAGEKKEEAA